MSAPSRLRKGYVIAAVVFLFVGFAAEYGGPNLPFFKGLLQSPQGRLDEAKTELDDKIAQARDDDDHEKERELQDAKDGLTAPKPPGYGIKADGLYMWTVFFAILISLIGMLVPKASVLRAGMIASLISSVIVILLSIVLIVKAIIELFIMFGLLASVFLAPIYFILYGTFPKGGVLSIAGFGLLCKVVAMILILVGGRQLLRLKSPILLFVTGYVTFLIIGLVLGIVPGPFAAIADGIIGIIIAIIVIIWSVVVLVGSIRGLSSGLL